jgi:hypothetical protein
MTQPDELVDLPDPETTPLVHPLDLPGARRTYLLSLFVAAATNPLTAIALVLLLWTVTGLGVVALPVGVGLYEAGRVGTPWFDRESWAYIPRSRQDRDRPLPMIWALAEALVLAAVSGVLMYVLVLSSPSIGGPEQVVAVFGTLLGVHSARAVSTALRPGGVRALVLDLPSLGAFATAVYLAGQHIGDFSLLWHMRNVALGVPIGAAFVFFGWIDTTRARRSMPTLHRRSRLLRS